MLCVSDIILIILIAGVGMRGSGWRTYSMPSSARSFAVWRGPMSGSLAVLPMRCTDQQLVAGWSRRLYSNGKTEATVCASSLLIAVTSKTRCPGSLGTVRPMSVEGRIS